MIAGELMALPLEPVLLPVDEFVELGAAYDNLGENAERWALCRGQVMGWQDLARKNGWVSTPAP